MISRSTKLGRVRFAFLLSIFLLLAGRALADTGARGWSAPQLVEEAHTHEARGEVGRAILALERAHMLSPRDGEVSAHLERARSAAGVASEPESRLKATLTMLSADEWTWLAFAFGLIACAGVVGVAWRYRPHAMRAIAVTGTLGLAASGLATYAVASPPDLAIVTTTSTARLSPIDRSESVFEALEGEAVRIEHERPGFSFVRSGERAGWIPRASLERVIPEDS